MSNKLDDFVAFILTNGRPDRVYTYETLARHGYTGKIILVVDNLDKTKDEYVKKYGDKVVIFDKTAIAKTFDQGDNFNDMRTIIYARNACFEIAKNLGIGYFIQLDDDYEYFSWRYDSKWEYLVHTPRCQSLDDVFCSMLQFLKHSRIQSIALSQGGDFIGGSLNEKAQKIFLMRKAMNSFLCSTERPFQFVGRINEDVNTYTRLASTGLLLFSTNFVSLKQKQTQSNAGGMTELYLDSGTYVKSFYSVMYMPSAVKVKVLTSKNARLHHAVSWINTAPMILSEAHKKNKS